MTKPLDKPVEASPFLAKLHAGLNRTGISDECVLVAVSGGADSVGLLRGLLDLAGTRSGHAPIIVAHFNHGWRGDESDADADWVLSLCEALSVRCIVGRNPESQSLIESESAARQMRYEFLQRTAVEHDACAILTAHTADDQAETILHHLIRGTGVAGLRGIPDSRVLHDGLHLLRPLLDVTRAEIESWLRSIGQDWRTDQTNRDARFTRNRIRHELLPLLERDYNGQIRKVLGSLASQAGELSDLVQSLATTIAAEVVLTDHGDSIRIDAAALARHPQALIREVLVLTWQRSEWPLQRMGYEQWCRLAELIAEGGSASLPGQVDARRRGELLVLTRATNS